MSFLLRPQISFLDSIPLFGGKVVTFLRFYKADKTGRSELEGPMNQAIKEIFSVVKIESGMFENKERRRKGREKGKIKGKLNQRTLYIVFVPYPLWCVGVMRWLNDFPLMLLQTCSLVDL